MNFGDPRGSGFVPKAQIWSNLAHIFTQSHLGV